MTKRNKRRRAKRQAVDRGDRIGPTRETLEKLRPWPINELVAQGALSADQFEACLEIVAAYRFITRIVGFKPLDLERIAAGHGDIGDRGERTFALYRIWGNAVQGFVPDGETRRYASLFVRAHVIVEMIEDERSVETVLLSQACSLWRRVADDYDKAKGVSRNSERHTIMTEQAIASAPA